MGGCNFDEKQLTAALHAAADSCDPPDRMKQQIDAQLAWQAKAVAKKEDIFMRKMNMKKAAAAAVMACALTGTVCVAAVKMSGYSTGSSSALTETENFADIAKLEKKAGADTNAVKEFANGFAFDTANIIDGEDIDDKGNVTDSYQEVIVSYEKDGKDISYIVRNGDRNYTEEDLARLQTSESDGVTYYFTEDNYLCVPDEADVTEEDRAAEAEGKLFISIGSSEREEYVSTHLSWNADGQSHSLFGSDLGMSAEELIEMAQQLK